jgi:hypothetical protein
MGRIGIVGLGDGNNSVCTAETMASARPDHFHVNQFTGGDTLAKMTIADGAVMMDCN